MKIERRTIEGTLSPKFIDNCSNEIRKFLTNLQLNNQDITRYCLSAEEILLDFSSDDNSKHVKVTMGKKLFSPFFSIEVEGVSKNVFIKEGEHSFLGDSILYNLNLSPEYNYQNGKNEYSFNVKRKKMNSFLVMLITFGVAITLGLLGLLLSANIRDAVTTSFITPVYETFINILSCLAGPMIFLSVAWGVYGVGDVSTLKRIGKVIFSGFILTIFFFVALFSIAGIPFFNWNYTTASTTKSELDKIFSMILQIFPNNIVSPFVEGNTMQIIFLAFIIGIALIFLGKKTTSVAKAIEQINYVIQFITELITKLVPFFIAIVIIKMIWTSSIGDFIGVWKLFAVFIAFTLIMALIIISFTAIKQKTNGFNLFKKGLPILLTAITTASSSATFSINTKICKEKFGIDKSIVAFGIPLGMVLFKITTAISYLVLAYYFAEFYAVEVSISWFILVIVTSVILAISTPPIPGGATIAYTILFTQFKIPMDALALTLACDVFLDFIDTGFDQFLLPFALINHTAKLDLLDVKTLRSKPDNSN